jgi:hypothetical protein
MLHPAVVIYEPGCKEYIFRNYTFLGEGGVGGGVVIIIIKVWILRSVPL